MKAELSALLSRERGELEELLCTLAQIPAPSGEEDMRAAFCRDFLLQASAEGIYIDEEKNLVYPIGCDGEGDIFVYMAHSDTVFPDTEALPLRREGGRIYCPRIGDDTANAVALLAVMRYLARQRIKPKGCGVLLVINSCEEGLGNLRGCRAIMKRYGARVKEFVSFDSTGSSCICRAVGSRRYRVEVETEGGHSYNDFGNRNAIACLSEMIGELYRVKVPEGGKTTYNVGLIEGGTSVNTIAQYATLTYEYRSDVREHLEEMECRFREIVSRFRERGLSLRVTLLGERPTGAPISEDAMRALTDRAARAVRESFGEEIALESGSTDCNIPLSMGIPAVCIGCVRGAGAHTREEYIDEASLFPGIGVAFDMILSHF